MNKKVTLQEESIREIAEAFALADLAARTPRESNPHIPMVKDELYKLALDNSAAGTFPSRSQYVFFAGVNGSGKTSFIRCMKNTQAFGSFRYICADEAENDLTHLSKTERMKTANLTARTYRNICLDHNADIIYESVASHPSHLDDLSAIAERGAYVTTVFVTTEDCEINLARIARRGRDNDSYLTPERVLRRRERSLANLNGFITRSDKALAFDNSINYKPVFIKTSAGEHIMLERAAWADKFIFAPLRESGIHVLGLADIDREQYVRILICANILKNTQ